MATKYFVTYTPSTGNGNGTVSVTVTENTGAERFNNLIVSGGEINKTIDITQKGSNLGSIEIAGGVYYSNGTLGAIRNFGIIANITASMTNPLIGRFIFPTPIVEMDIVGGTYNNSFLRIKVSKEISSHYKGEKVVAFLENVNGNTIYTPKKDLTVDVYRMGDRNVFDLDIADGVNLNNTEIIDINSALNNRQNIAILLTNNKKIQFINFIWKAVYHDS